MWEKLRNFPHKTLWIATVSPQMVFFLMTILKLPLLIFFLILSWLRITITSKVKSCGEAL